MRWTYNLINPTFRNQILASALCNFSIMVWGSCYTWLEPITLYLISAESDIKMNLDDISWLTSIMESVAALFGIGSGYMMDRWGRKATILSTAPVCLISWLLVLFTRNLAILYPVRLIQGYSVVSSAASAVYIAEVSSPKVRGTLAGHGTGLMYLGFLYTYFISYFFSYQNYIYFLMILPLINFCTFLFMPETPYYYLMTNKREEAKKSLSWLRASEDVDQELAEIEQAVIEDMNNQSGFKDLFATKSDRKALFIVTVVSVVYYLSGVMAITSYGMQTFAAIRMIKITPEQLTIIMGVILCLTALFSSSLSDKIGRKPLLIVSSIGTVICNLVISIYYYLYEIIDINVTQFVWIMYVAIFFFCIFINLGLGLALPILRGEYFPSHTRAMGSGLVSSIAGICIFIHLKIYQTIIDEFGIYMNFLIYGVTCFIGAILLKIYVIESSGKTLAQLNKDIKEVC